MVSSFLTSLVLLPGDTASAAPTTPETCTAAGGTWSEIVAGHGGLETRGVCSGTTMASEMSLEDQVKSYAYYRALGDCVESGANNLSNGGGFDSGKRITQANAKSGNWFSSVIVNGSYLNGDDGIKSTGTDDKIECKQSELVNGALKLWGSWAPDEALCAFGFRMADDNEFSAGRCTNAQGGTDEFKRGSDMSKYETAVKDRVYGGKDPVLSDPAKYLLYLKTFQQTCALGGVVSANVPTGITDRDYKVRQASRDGANVPITDTYYTGRSNKTQGEKVDKFPDSRLHFGASSDPANMTCGDVVKAINGDDGKNNGLADKYQAYLLQNTGAPDSSSKPAQSCGTAACSATPGDTTTCNIPEMGWILCPVLNTGASVADAAYGFLADKFLPVQPSLVNTNPAATGPDGKLIGTGTYTAWKSMRDFANVAFVIAFMIILFSQLTGMGINNYGIKKLLPRIVIAAILVNLSFFICQIAIDISNIAGVSIKGLFQAVADQVTAKSVPATGTTDTLATGSLVGIVGAALIVGSAAWINIGAILIAVVGAVVVLLTIFVLLALRQVLVVLLVVISPLAFVAYLLPNTEPWFQKWRKALTAMLMLFPIVGVIYGAGLLANAILKQVAGTDTTMAIFAYLALVLPLIVVLPLLKGSMDAVGNIGGMVNKLGDRTKGLAQKRGEKAYDNSRLGQFKKYREGEKNRRRGLVQAGVYSGKGGNTNPLNLLSKMNKRFNDSQLSGSFGNRSAAAGIEAASKIDDEQVGAALTMMKAGTDAADMLTRKDETGKEIEGKAAAGLRKALISGDTIKARAAQQILLNSGAAGLNELQQVLESNATNKMTGTASSLRKDLNSAGLKGKNNALASWAYNTKSLVDTISDSSVYSGLNDEELVGQDLANLERGDNHNFVTQSQAHAIVKNAQVFKNLSPEKKKFFAAKADGTYVPKSGDAVSTAGQSVHDRAQQVAAEAAAGTSGTQPIVVGSSGIASLQQTVRQRTAERAAIEAEGTRGSEPFVVDHTGTVRAESSIPVSYTDENGRQTPGSVDSGQSDDYHQGQRR
ncbi:hypothetical protein OOZ51_00345 [Arthrobacter sp. MI7-26]|uniref:hypothetical protein n=1 Tax=Arthrobacter sp. MI7-26 TaxID=2993653 RepID=UPI002248953B|nr:hypothetical protein [Arthrobacter sp. MI7-26]MCX2746262.1 hypothetical protein [Arthrobacter sp. MI7-26]